MRVLSDFQISNIPLWNRLDLDQYSFLTHLFLSLNTLNNLKFRTIVAKTNSADQDQKSSGGSRGGIGGSFEPEPPSPPPVFKYPLKMK